MKKAEKRLIQELAELDGMSVAEYTRRVVLEKISVHRVEVAFKLLEEGKIGRKRAWTLSGLSNMEFLDEWTKRGAEEILSDKIIEEELDLAKSIDLKKYLISNPDV